jgi:hypothetical protein
MYEYTEENPGPPPPCDPPYCAPDSVEWFVEDQAFLPSHDLAPPPPLPHFVMHQVVSLSQSSCLSPVELTDRGVGWGRSQIIWQRESQVLFKSFRALCFTPNRCQDKFWFMFQTCSWLVSTIPLTYLKQTEAEKLPIWWGWSLDFPLNILSRFFLFGAVQCTVRKSYSQSCFSAPQIFRAKACHTTV